MKHRNSIHSVNYEAKIFTPKPVIKPYNGKMIAVLSTGLKIHLQRDILRVVKGTECIHSRLIFPNYIENHLVDICKTAKAEYFQVKIKNKIKKFKVTA